LPSIAAIVGIGSAASAGDPRLELERLAAARAPVASNSFDVRPDRERALAAPGHDDGPDVAGLALERSSAASSLEERPS
jgi:hypothetical protein